MKDIVQNIRNIDAVFKRHGVEFMFIGRGAAIMQGLPALTQDVDVFPLKSLDNNAKIVAALSELGFELSPEQEQEVKSGKDFVQFTHPFEFDLVFAPDGFESYQDALKFKTEVDGIPVLSIAGIIKNKAAANRPKDREALPLLRDFAKYLKKESVNDHDRDVFDRHLEISLDQRLLESSLTLPRPVLDDAKVRIFNTMADYNRFCNECLPPFLGMGTSIKSFQDFCNEARKIEDGGGDDSDIWEDKIKVKGGVIELERTTDWDIVWILDIKVDKDKQGQGIATQMLEQLFKKIGSSKHAPWGRIVHPGTFVCDSVKAQGLLRVMRRLSDKYGIKIGEFGFDPQPEEV
jgi:GNAT superfamily N-acetyltransferase